MKKCDYIAVFMMSSSFLLGQAAIAQPVSADIDYSELLDAHDRQQEEFWRPLLDVVLEDAEDVSPEGAQILLNHHHAARGAVFLPADNTSSLINILPKNSQFEQLPAVSKCQSNNAAGDNAKARAAAYAGDGASFALRGAPSDCEGGFLAVSSAGQKDEQDLGVYLSPALAECADGACTLRGVKGEIRVGEFTEHNKGAGGWYMYAAADGTRVVWEERPSGILELDKAVDVSDSLTMGDLEAGIMLSNGPADVSLNYVHRRTKFQTWDDKVVDNSDYVGVKISID